MGSADDALLGGISKGEVVVLVLVLLVVVVVVRFGSRGKGMEKSGSNPKLNSKSDWLVNRTIHFVFVLLLYLRKERVLAVLPNWQNHFDVSKNPLKKMRGN
jgi:hypothetical protein